MRELANLTKSAGIAFAAMLLYVVLVTGRAVAQNAGANLAEQYLQMAADQERAALNLPPLRRDSALVTAAKLHAMRMVEHGSISHQFDHEPDLAARGSSAGARFSLISENVAESPSAVKIHDAWMHSEGHRHNLLDPNVDAVGIAVIARGRQLYAVEDFERTVRVMTIAQQENTVATELADLGIKVEQTDLAARSACSESREPTGAKTPSFTMRYTTANITRLPEQLRTQLATRKYVSAVVGACPAASGEDFSMYRLAVLLFRKSN